MKPWQKGIELETIKEYETLYNESSNKYAFSPFVGFNKPSIADAMSKGELVSNVTVDASGNEDLLYSMRVKEFKARSPIKSFGNIIYYKEKGDIEVSAIAYHKPSSSIARHAISEKLQSLKSTGQKVWVYIFEEDSFTKDIVKSCGYTKVCSQYKSTAEVIGVYCSVSLPDLNPAYDKVSLKKLDVKLDQKSIDLTTSYFTDLGSDSFKNHYSKYNKGESWSALSLRGFSDDITMIEKPTAMGAKKAAAYVEKYGNELRDTHIMPPSVLKLIDDIFTSETKIERVRFMKLTPNGGELQRHSDLVDPDIGTQDGSITRFHIPIITNPKVEFSVWDWNGDKQTYNPQVNELWYLDLRKPHTVVNNGDTDRIHLVIDVFTNEHVRGLIGE